MSAVVGWLALTLAWMLGAFGSGAALALLYRRLHPELSFYKLWAFWTAILGGMAALVLAWGIV